MENTANIGGRKYDFGFLPAMESVFLQIDIVKTIGEPLFKAFMTAQEGDLSAEQAGGMLIGLLSANLDPALIQKNLLIVFKYVFCDGKRVTNLDETFTGHPMATLNPRSFSSSSAIGLIRSFPQPSVQAGGFFLQLGDEWKRGASFPARSVD